MTGSSMTSWTVKRLAEAWSCSERQIYDLIHEGSLRAFSVGKRDTSGKRLSGLRISDEEKRRWENLHVEIIDPETSHSDGEVTSQSQNIAMLAASAAVSG